MSRIVLTALDALSRVADQWLDFIDSAVPQSCQRPSRSTLVAEHLQITGGSHVNVPGMR